MRELVVCAAMRVCTAVRTGFPSKYIHRTPYVQPSVRSSCYAGNLQSIPSSIAVVRSTRTPYTFRNTFYIIRVRTRMGVGQQDILVFYLIV